MLYSNVIQLHKMLLQKSHHHYLFLLLVLVLPFASSNPLEEPKVSQATKSVVQLEIAKELKSNEEPKVSQATESVAQLESAKDQKSDADEESYGIVSVDGVAGGAGIEIPREKRQLLGALLHGVLHGGEHYDDHHHHHGGYGKFLFLLNYIHIFNKKCQIHILLLYTCYTVNFHLTSVFLIMNGSKF